jgi:cytochrome c
MGGFGATLARQHLLPVVSLCSKVQPMAYIPKIALPFLLVCTLAASPLAQAGSALAVEMGCYSCHGNAYHPNAPSFAQLASHTAKHRGEAGAEDHLMNELRKPHLVGRIGAHEHLSEESARGLARWILDGAH